jgi:hypothetical protein
LRRLSSNPSLDRSVIAALQRQKPGRGRARRI